MKYDNQYSGCMVIIYRQRYRNGSNYRQCEEGVVLKASLSSGRAFSFVHTLQEQHHSQVSNTQYGYKALYSYNYMWQLQVEILFLIGLIKLGVLLIQLVFQPQTWYTFSRQIKMYFEASTLCIDKDITSTCDCHISIMNTENMHPVQEVS